MTSNSSGSCGNARNRSVTHISTASTLPLEMPDIAPIRVPAMMATAIAAKPTASEIRPPYSMRASRSWPRSSVPNGCCHDGEVSRAVKSISLIGTRQISGPSTTADVSTVKITTLATAMRWRRNFRHASKPREVRRGRPSNGTVTSTVGDAWVKPAIDDISQEVEDDNETGEHERHRHDDRRVIGENRRDQQRADAGDAEDLFGDDGTAEHGRHLQRDQRHHGYQCIANHVLDDDLAFVEALRARGRDIVQADDIKHRGAHVPSIGCRLKQAEDRDQHDGLLEVFPIPVPPGGGDIGAIDEGQPAEIDAEDQDQQQPREESRQRKTDKGERVGDLVEDRIRPHRGKYADGERGRQGQNLRRADDIQGGRDALQDQLVDVDAA